jgi:hypothetical protein
MRYVGIRMMKSVDKVGRECSIYVRDEMHAKFINLKGTWKTWE